MKRNTVIYACTLAGGALLAGCASAPEAPTAEIASAAALIEQTRPAAARYAPEQLRHAQLKLAQAREAVAREDYEQARRLAEQAEADARLASAVAQNQRMHEAVAEVNAGLDDLRRGIERRNP